MIDAETVRSAYDLATRETSLGAAAWVLNRTVARALCPHFEVFLKRCLGRERYRRRYVRRKLNGGWK